MQKSLLCQPAETPEVSMWNLSAALVKPTFWCFILQLCKYAPENNVSLRCSRLSTKEFIASVILFNIAAKISCYRFKKGPSCLTSSWWWHWNNESLWLVDYISQDAFSRIWRLFPNIFGWPINLVISAGPIEHLEMNKWCFLNSATPRIHHNEHSIKWNVQNHAVSWVQLPASHDCQNVKCYG